MKIFHDVFIVMPNHVHRIVMINVGAPIHYKSRNPFAGTWEGAINRAPTFGKDKGKDFFSLMC